MTELASHRFINGLFDVRCVVTDLPIPRRRVRHAATKYLEGEDSQEHSDDNEPVDANANQPELITSADGNQRTKEIQRLAICTAVGETDFYLFDIDTNQVIGAFSGHTATVTTVKRDGDLVVSYHPRRPWPC